MAEEQEGEKRRRRLVCPYCGREMASRSFYTHIVKEHSTKPEGADHPEPPAVAVTVHPADAEHAGDAQDPPPEQACPAASDGWHDWQPLNPAIALHAQAMALGYVEYCRHCEELWAPEGGAADAPE